MRTLEMTKRLENGDPIPKAVPRKLAQMIEFWDDEREEGNSLIVTLKDGFTYHYESGNHAAGFDTIREAIDALKRVEECKCQQCVPE